MESQNYPMFTYVWGYPNMYVPSQTYYMAPIVAVEPTRPKICEAEPELEESVIDCKAVKQSKAGKRKQKKNVRNIIPNISRKLINYLCSSRSSNVIKLVDPKITGPEVESFYEFARRHKSSMSFYIGNKDLMRIWYGPGEPQDEKFYFLMRVLSKHYLENQCANSILLSRRIKPSLKADHLKYRRKILRLLFSQTSPQQSL